MRAHVRSAADVRTRPSQNDSAKRSTQWATGSSFSGSAANNSAGTGSSSLPLSQDFSGVHAAQIDSSGIPDEPYTRLVLMAAQYTHRKGVDFSAALQWAGGALQSKGNSPRQYQNTLVFIAPDEQNLENLLLAMAERKAWEKVLDEKLLLNLTVTKKTRLQPR